MDIDKQKIKSFFFKTYNIIKRIFSIPNKLSKIWFMKKRFLFINTSLEVVLKIFFLAFSNINILFDTKSFIKKFYTTAKILLTDIKINLI